MREKPGLKGLSPKENRDVPPLDYGLVHALKQRFPEVPVVLNGGLSTLAEMSPELDHVDGVMVGRAAYQNPALLLDVDAAFFKRRPNRRPGGRSRLFFPMSRRGLPKAFRFM